MVMGIDDMMGAKRGKKKMPKGPHMMPDGKMMGKKKKKKKGKINKKMD